MEEGNQLLFESFKSLSAVLKNGSATPDVKPAIDYAERGIRAVTSAPAIDPQADQYRARLLKLLTLQKNILSEFAQSASKNRARLTEEENAVIEQREQFLSDYNSWVPGFLKERGYRRGESTDR